MGSAGNNADNIRPQRIRWLAINQIDPTQRYRAQHTGASGGLRRTLRTTAAASFKGRDTRLVGRRGFVRQHHFQRFSVHVGQPTVTHSAPAEPATVHAGELWDARQTKSVITNRKCEATN
jgi:hypothetical protein